MDIEAAINFWRVRGRFEGRAWVERQEACEGRLIRPHDLEHQTAVASSAFSDAQVGAILIALIHAGALP
ncbi:hypothetical protein ACZ75_06830 [Massilia sp. NR 4-1]|nr:hypothetical protein ACZ75_06830 [Massilia sp. NR 4-1]